MVGSIVFKLMIFNFKNFMAHFYGWSSTASRLQPLGGGSFLFTIQFSEIPCTHFIDLGRMKDWVDPGATMWFWTRDPWIGNPAPIVHLCWLKERGVKILVIFCGRRKCLAPNNINCFFIRRLTKTLLSLVDWYFPKL